MSLDFLASYTRETQILGRGTEGIREDVDIYGLSFLFYLSQVTVKFISKDPSSRRTPGTHPCKGGLLY